MEIRFTKHALERMAERDITESFIRTAILMPRRMEVSRKDGSRFLIKTLRQTKDKQHLVMIVCERSRTETVVITVIDTSKINKYS